MIIRAATSQAQHAGVLASSTLDWLNRQVKERAQSPVNPDIPSEMSSEIAELIKKQDISPAAEAVIREVIERSPTRRPQGRGGNWKGIFQSKKMRCGIFFESLGEYSLILRLEHDPDVIAFFPQPPSMLLRYAGPTGKGTRAQHTPDFFVITRKGFGWIEVKPDDELEKYEGNQSERFKEVNRVWICPPGMAYASQFGFTYDVHTSSSIHPNFVRNARFVKSYLEVKTPIRQVAVEAVANLLSVNPSTTLLTLLNELKDRASDDEIYRLIVSGHIHFDWNRSLLMEPEEVMVFADPETMTVFHESHSDEPVDPGAIDVVPGNRILMDGASREILNVGVRSITLSTADKRGQDLPYQTFRRMVEEGNIRPDPSSPSCKYHPFVQKRMLEATDDELAEATRRARWIRAHLRDGARKPKHVSDRSWRRWLKDSRDAEEAFGNGFIGLIPATHKRGNRKPRMAEELYQRISKHIGTHYETPDAPNANICWALFREESIEQGLEYCDLGTYCRVISFRNKGTQTLLRKGARAARKYEKWYQPSSGPSLPKKADRPWEKAHIDHTEIDLESPYGASEEYTNRCWLTAMV
ncbi:MAG: TnsA endonuclease N-terminal domain-containing protein, partial [Terracidiphilus sp.]